MSLQINTRKCGDKLLPSFENAVHLVCIHMGQITEKNVAEAQIRSNMISDLYGEPHRDMRDWIGVEANVCYDRKPVFLNALYKRYQSQQREREYQESKKLRAVRS